MGFFEVLTDEWGRDGVAKATLHRICHTYSAIMKLCTPKEDPKNI